jgi:FKBP-type peptidyl-prolyl cis-trans isomerase 2
MLAGFLATISAAAFAEEEAKPVVAEGKQISIEYTLTLEGGEVADSNVGEDALTYTQGAGQILPALEQALVGMAVGDTRNVELSAAEGYGVVDPELFQTVEASMVPEDARHAGAQLMAQGGDGRARPVRVHEVKGDEIVIDLNHPLAGEDLSFAIKILAIE